MADYTAAEPTVSDDVSNLIEELHGEACASGVGKAARHRAVTELALLCKGFAEVAADNQARLMTIAEFIDHESDDA